MERQARDGSKSQGEPAGPGSSYPLMPPNSGGSGRPPTPPPRVHGSVDMLGAKDANLEHVLKEKELELGTKDAHLRMLRSRLDMADRDAEEMRRKLDAANARLAAAGGNPASDGDTNRNNDNNNNNNNNNNGSNYAGPNARDVSNAAALAEAKAEVARLRAQVAFREEEADEARRREDDQRARLQRAEAETMKLAAEVRSERRRAEQMGTNDGGVKRASEDSDGSNPRSSKRHRGAEPGDSGAIDEENRFRDSHGDDRRSRRGPMRRDHPPPPVTLVLPPPPPYALRTNDASSAEHASTSYGARLSAAALVGAISARFPSETCALLGDDVHAAALGLHVSGPDDVEGGAVLLETIKNVSRTLRNLAADVGDARALAAACADVCEAAADAPYAAVKSCTHLERSLSKQSRNNDGLPDDDDVSPGVYGGGISIEQKSGGISIAGVLSVLSAAVAADQSVAAHVLQLCGAPLATVPTSVAPRAPPPQLAGIPAASGVGALVPHPDVPGRSSRVFALAPGDTVADIAAAAAAETLIERPDDTEGGSRVLRENGVWGRTHAGPLLENVLAILAASTASGAWATATAACEFLARCVAASPAMEGRGIFVACVADGHLERCLAPCRPHKRLTSDGIQRGQSRRSIKTANALAAAWAHESTSASVNKRTPPPGLRVRALVVARLLAATDAFAAFLDDEGGAGPTAGESSGKSTGKSTAGTAAANNDVVDLTGIEPTGTQTGTGDRENRDREEHEPSPLLAAVVACCAADFNVDEKNASVDDDTAVQVSDAALSVVHALSHGGWRGWGDAVRAHAILPAAVDACDAAFRRRAACSNGVGSDSSTADGVKAERRVKSALMLVARLLAEPGSAARAIASLRRDGETARTLARVAAAAGAHPELMPRRVGRYFASLLPTVMPQVGE